MNIGQRIREVREDLGMQAAVLARRVEVAPNTIYRIETGDRLPSVGLLEKIAWELRTEPAELLRGPNVPLAEVEALGDPAWVPREDELEELRELARGELPLDGRISARVFEAIHRAYVAAVEE